MHIGIVFTKICPSECGKLNVRSFVPTFALKIVALRIFDFGNVMVPNVNKFGSTTKNFFFLP
jgi:hypothetical protein